MGTGAEGFTGPFEGAVFLPSRNSSLFQGLSALLRRSLYPSSFFATLGDRLVLDSRRFFQMLDHIKDLLDRIESVDANTNFSAILDSNLLKETL
jgi:hypothetical protein